MINAKGFIQRATESISRALGSPPPEDKKGKRPATQKSGRQDSFYDDDYLFVSSSGHRPTPRGRRHSKADRTHETPNDTAARLYDDWSRHSLRQDGQLKDRSSRYKRLNHRHHRPHKTSRDKPKTSRGFKAESPHPTPHWHRERDSSLPSEVTIGNPFAWFSDIREPRAEDHLNFRLESARTLSAPIQIPSSIPRSRTTGLRAESRAPLHPDTDWESELPIEFLLGQSEASPSTRTEPRAESPTSFQSDADWESSLPIEILLGKLDTGSSAKPKSSTKIQKNKPVVEDMQHINYMKPNTYGNKERVCSLCADESIDPSSKFGSRILECCGKTSSVCQDCLSHWIDSSLGDGKKGVAIKCAEEGCNDVLSYWNIMDMVNTETREKFEKMVFTGVLRDMDEFVRCPFETCGNGQLYPEYKTNPRMRCHACKKESCIKHGVPWHENQTCEEYDERKNIGNPKRAKEEEASKKEIASTSKPCPGCKAPIQRIEGCDHMTCGACRANFCWICLGVDEDPPNSADRGLWRWHYKDCPSFDGAYSKEPTKRRASAKEATNLTTIPDVGSTGARVPRIPDGTAINPQVMFGQGRIPLNPNVQDRNINNVGFNFNNNAGYNFQRQPQHQNQPAFQYGYQPRAQPQPAPQYQAVPLYVPNAGYLQQPANYMQPSPAVMAAFAAWSRLPNQHYFLFQDLPMPAHHEEGIQVARIIYGRLGYHDVPLWVMQGMLQEVYRLHI